MASSSGNDDDLTIPRAAINKMIKETLPNVRVANDARELVVNCCTEFIHLISSEANEICNKSDKKTISPEHVINGWYWFTFTTSVNIAREWRGDAYANGGWVQATHHRKWHVSFQPLVSAPQPSRALVSDRTSQRWKTSCRNAKRLLWRGGRPALDWKTWAFRRRNSWGSNRSYLPRSDLSKIHFHIWFEHSQMQTQTGNNLQAGGRQVVVLRM